MRESGQVALQPTPDGDELADGHLSKTGYKKVRNVRNDPRLAVNIVSPGGPGHPISLWLSINGTAWIQSAHHRGVDAPERN